MHMTLEKNHCDDCCCAQSWKALSITEYTGKSIPEHIAELIHKLQVAKEALERISKLDYSRAALNGCAYSAVDTAAEALATINQKGTE